MRADGDENQGWKERLRDHAAAAIGVASLTWDEAGSVLVLASAPLGLAWMDGFRMGSHAELVYGVYIGALMLAAWSKKMAPGQFGMAMGVFQKRAPGKKTEEKEGA
jgi:hypothetical protein